MNNNYNNQDYNQYGGYPQQPQYPNYGYNQYGENNAMYYNPQTGMYEQRTNQLALIGFILSIFMNIVGAIICIVALSQIKKTGESGKGLAVAGIIIGFLPVIIFLGIFALLIFIGVAAESEYDYDYDTEYYSGKQIQEYITDAKSQLNNYHIDFENNIIEVLK